jgi:hypothetical protein
MRRRKKRHPTMYAAYDGDEFLDMGTANELAVILGIKPESVQWQASRTGVARSMKHGRRMIIRVPELEEGEE